MNWESNIIDDLASVAGRYRTIVVDFPWPVNHYGAKSYRRLRHELPYDDMDLDTIRAFPFGRLAAEQAHCFLWTTHKHLPLSIELLAQQGFAYRWTGVWHKSNGGLQLPGMPALNCEFVVYGSRGDARDRAGMFVDTTEFTACFRAKRGRHSEKPAYFYEMLERVSQPPRIDVFARRRHAGFDAWGNEVEDHLQPALGTRA